MRKIKFRGKRKDNGKWVYGFLVRGNEGNFYIITHLNESCINEVEGEDFTIFEVIPEYDTSSISGVFAVIGTCRTRSK